MTTTETTTTAPAPAPTTTAPAEGAPTSSPPAAADPPASGTVSGADHPNAPPAAASSPAPTTEAAKVDPAAGAMKVQPPPDLPFEPRNFAEAYRWARWGAATRFVAPQVRDRPDDVMFLIMLGRRWGLDVVASLQIYVIDGKPSLPAAHMVGIVKASRLCDYFDPTASTMERAEWATRRVGKNGQPGRETILDYTIAEADMMGLLDKGRTPGAAERNQWNRQPRTMLRWRAATSLARLVYPDLLTGMYSVEEMVDVLETKGGRVDIVEVARADLDKAKDALYREGVPAIVRDLRGLPEPVADAMDQTMTGIAQGSVVPAPVTRERDRDPVPITRATTTSRISERAREAQGRRQGGGRGEPDMFERGRGDDPRTDPRDELAVCGVGRPGIGCGVPIAQGQTLCPACQDQ